MPPWRSKSVRAVVVQLARRGIERERDVLAVACALGGLEDRLAGVVCRLEVGREPPFVADPGREAALHEELLQVVVRLDPDPERLREGLRPGRHEHELLEVEAVLRVGPAVDDVQQRNREDVRVRPADPAIQRQARIGGSRLRDRERGPEDRVRPEPRLRRRPVEVDQRPVDRALVVRVEAEDRLGDLAVDVGDGAGDALPEPGVTAVAQLHGLALPGRRAGRNHGEAECARVEADLHLDRRVPARIEHLASVEMDDLAHGVLVLTVENTESASLRGSV